MEMYEMTPTVGLAPEEVSKKQRAWEVTKLVVAGVVAGAASAVVYKTLNPIAKSIIVAPPMAENAFGHIFVEGTRILGVYGISSLVAAKVSEDTLDTLNSVDFLVAQSKRKLDARKKKDNDRVKELKAKYTEVN